MMWFGIALGATVFASSASASPAYARAEMPWLAQKQHYDCGRAALASLIAWREGASRDGVAAAERAYEKIAAPRNAMLSIASLIELAKPFDLDLRTTSPRPVLIVSPLAKPEQVTSAEYFSFLSTLRTSFAQAEPQPLLVPIFRRGLPHYIVIVGAQDDGFIVRDPDPATRGDDIVIRDTDLVPMLVHFQGLMLQAAKTGD
jgi:hypothetical protein